MKNAVVYAGMMACVAFAASRFGRRMQMDVDNDIMEEQNELMERQNELNLQLVNQRNFLAMMCEVLKNELD